MSATDAPLTRSQALRSMLPVWLFAAVGGALAGVFLNGDYRFGGLCLALATAVLLAFVIQLAVRRREGYVDRITGSIVGAVLVAALCSVVIALTG